MDTEHRQQQQQQQRRGSNFRSEEISYTYLLEEVLEMIRVEDQQCWSKHLPQSAKKDVREAVGEVLRAFYGFVDVESELFET